MKENLKCILEEIKKGNNDQVKSLIDKYTQEELNTLFENTSKRKTTLLCEAALLKNNEMVQYLLDKGADLHIDFGWGNSSNIFSKMIFAEDFNEDSIPICKLLIKSGINLHIKENNEYNNILGCIFSLINEENDNFVEKTKLLKKIMGEEFYSYLLYFPTRESCPALVKLVLKQAYFKETYSEMLNEIITHLNNREISETEWAVLKIVSAFDEKIMGFIEKKLSNNKQDIANIQVQKIYNVNEQYCKLASSLFNYENEKNAFNYNIQLLDQPLSSDNIIEIHDKGLSKKDTKGLGHMSKAGILLLNESVSAHGFLELKELESQYQWFNLRNYDPSSLNYALCPTPKVENLEKLTTEYNKDMKSLFSWTEKLKRIIKFASDISRMHYFADANKRTAYIILNSELVKNGFLPTILENRMILRGYSQSEIYIEVLKGMEKYWDLNKNEIEKTQDKVENKKRKRILHLYKLETTLKETPLKSIEIGGYDLRERPRKKVKK